MITSPGALALYLHFPFCRQKCAYCDFNSHVPMDREIGAYLGALRAELPRWAERLGTRPVTSIYLGGGTPTVVPADDLVGLLEALGALYTLAPDVEITCEANPGTVDEAYLRRLREGGVNRLSLGVQSFREPELRLLGRIHSAEDAREAVRAARAAGFDNLSLDLIAGLPGQSVAAWEENLAEALALAPEHLSCYGLSIPAGTALAARLDRREIEPLEETAAAAIWESTDRVLTGAGYAHYEVSNFARPGRECRQNLTYWRGGEYLGFGVSAASHWGRHRWSNVAEVAEYVERLSLGQNAALPGESLSPEQRLGERLMLALRTAEGADLQALREEFGETAVADLAPAAAEMETAGLLESPGENWRPTRLGMLLNNQLALAFLAAAEG
jgi:oxygen-independent coproporphyrinogen-3 oxidase